RLSLRSGPPDLFRAPPGASADPAQGLEDRRAGVRCRAENSGLKRLEVRHSAAEIASRVAAVAEEIDRQLRGSALGAVSILKGSAILMADLSRRIHGSFSCQYLHVRRVEGAHDVLQIDFTTGFTVRNKHVLLLKDVVHTGVIETYLMDQLRSEG